LIPNKKGQTAFNASAKGLGGNRQHFKLLASGLSENATHTLKLVPLLDLDEQQELRLESICIAGAQPVTIKWVIPRR
jgi:hypothetical protein